jgi:hypothetical protein
MVRRILDNNGVEIEEVVFGAAVADLRRHAAVAKNLAERVR